MASKYGDIAWQGCNENNEMRILPIVEPQEDTSLQQQSYMNRALSDFQEHLTERSDHLLGYHLNLNCNHFNALSPFLCFHINNVGDPFIESNIGLNSKKFEIGVLNWFAQLWGIEEDEYWGFITNGGSEGNFQGLLLGRELFPDGMLYTSKESHYSILKAIKMYRMDHKIMRTMSTGEIDYNELRANLNLNRDKPAIVNANIGTTFKGGVDNIDLIIKILEECGFSKDRYYIHCDAALNGLISPFLDHPCFSFKKAIGSVIVSAHKLLGSPMPCGVFMTRRQHISLLSQRVEYISTLDNTISGSRNGHAPVLMWYSLNMQGHVGLRRDVKKCLENAQYLRSRLRNVGISTMLNNNSVVVVLERPLDQRFINHWQLSCTGNMAHVVVMPHVTTEVLNDFIDDLVRKRRIWYGSAGMVQPLCIAEDIGTWNCSCPSHSIY